MHTYRREPQGNGNYLYVVGFECAGGFRPMRDFAKAEHAARYVSFLNGGEPVNPLDMATRQ